MSTVIYSVLYTIKRGDCIQPETLETTAVATQNWRFSDMVLNLERQMEQDTPRIKPGYYLHRIVSISIKESGVIHL
jgi:hypothetical protein